MGTTPLVNSTLKHKQPLRRLSLALTG